MAGLISTWLGDSRPFDFEHMNLILRTPDVILNHFKVLHFSLHFINSCYLGADENIDIKNLKSVTLSTKK